MLCAGANVLVTNKGELKLADFGLARQMKASGDYTNRVVRFLPLSSDDSQLCS